MGYFDDVRESRWSRGYGYARDVVTTSPTLFTAIMTIIACVTSVLSGMEDISSVAGPSITALLFIFHNIHVRKSHKQVSDALEQVKDVRAEVGFTREELTGNSEHTRIAATASSEAAISAAAAAASAKRIEELVQEQKKILEEMRKKK